MQERGAAGHRLGDAAHEACLLGAGQDPSPHAMRCAIDPRPDMGEDLGHMLDLVEDGRQRHLVEEALWILSQAADDRGILEQVVARLRELPSQEMCLADAPWPGQHHSWELTQGGRQARLEETGHVPH